MSNPDETVTLRVVKPAPKPDLVHAWLVAHGWEEDATPDALAGKWRDYRHSPCREMSVPQMWGKGGYRSTMSETLAYLAMVHRMSPLELYAEIMREEVCGG